jgi:hypothetical protein
VCEAILCVLDAAIFASFDNGGWTEANIISQSPSAPKRKENGARQPSSHERQNRSHARTDFTFRFSVQPDREEAGSDYRSFFRDGFLAAVSFSPFP